MNRANKKAPSAFLQRHRCENRNHETRSRSLGGGQLNSVSAVFDSPVIYGVRVETSNPYYLLISKRYLVYGLRLAVKRENVKRVFLLFSHFYDINFVSPAQRSGCHRSCLRCGPGTLYACPEHAAYPRRPEKPSQQRYPPPQG